MKHMAINYYLPTTLAKDGKITVPAKLLADFVSNLPKGEIKLEAKDSQKNFFNPITTLCSSLWLERLLYSLFLC